MPHTELETLGSRDAYAVTGARLGAEARTEGVVIQAAPASIGDRRRPGAFAGGAVFPAVPAASLAAARHARLGLVAGYLRELRSVQV